MPVTKYGPAGWHLPIASALSNQQLRRIFSDAIFQLGSCPAHSQDVRKGTVDRDAVAQAVRQGKCGRGTTSNQWPSFTDFV